MAAHFPCPATTRQATHAACGAATPELSAVQKAAINNIEGMKDGVPRKSLLVLQVFVSSDSMGSEPIIGAGICIASTDLLFTEHTVEQASLLLAVIFIVISEMHALLLRTAAV